MESKREQESSCASKGCAAHVRTSVSQWVPAGKVIFFGSEAWAVSSMRSHLRCSVPVSSACNKIESDTAQT